MPKKIKVGSTKLRGFPVTKEDYRRLKEIAPLNGAIATDLFSDIPRGKQQKLTPEKRLESFAQTLKENATESELVLLDAIKQRNWNVEFQKPLFLYIPDFYFPYRMRIVELDGAKFHDKERDKRRDVFFKKRGIKTLRIKSHRVFHQLDWVMQEIEQFVFGKNVKKRSKKARVKKKVHSKRILDNYFKANPSSDECLQGFLRKTEDL